MKKKRSEKGEEIPWGIKPVCDKLLKKKYNKQCITKGVWRNTDLFTSRILTDHRR